MTKIPAPNGISLAHIVFFNCYWLLILILCQNKLFSMSWLCNYHESKLQVVILEAQPEGLSGKTKGNRLLRPCTSFLEYSATVWHPHQNYNSYKLEMVQRMAARFVKGRYGMYESVTQMLEELTWVPLDKHCCSYMLMIN